MAEGWGVCVLWTFGSDLLVGPMEYREARAIAAAMNQALGAGERAAKRFERWSKPR